MDALIGVLESVEEQLKKYIVDYLFFLEVAYAVMLSEKRESEMDLAVKNIGDIKKAVESYIERYST